jgi:U3 small nucleolar RNA-associated protein 10
LQIGEEFLLLLPECLPFLSELLEDDNSEVSDFTGVVVRYIEDLSGETLDQWF